MFGIGKNNIENHNDTVLDGLRNVAKWVLSERHPEELVGEMRQLKRWDMLITNIEDNIRSRLRPIAEATGDVITKSTVRLTLDSGTVNVTTQVSKEPNDDLVIKLLREKSLPITAGMDEIKILIPNRSKLEGLVTSNIISATEFESCFKKKTIVKID